MKKTRLLLLLVLLMTAATGAWAQTETLLTTITATGTDSYSETTPGVVTVTHDNDYIFGEYGWVWWTRAGSVTVEAKDGYTISKCVFRQAGKNPVTVSSAPFKVNFIYDEDDEEYYCEGGDPDEVMDGVSSIEVYGYAPAAPATKYNLTLAEGTEDADKWTISPNPAEEGETVTVTYSGERKVKSVKAVKKAPAGPPSWKLTLSSPAKDLCIIANGGVIAQQTLDVASTEFTVEMPELTSQTVNIFATDGSGNCWYCTQENMSFAIGQTYQSSPTMTALDEDNSKPLYKITGTSGVTIPDGKTVVLSGVNISSGSITCSGNATMILMGANTVTATATGEKAAIKIGGSGTTLTITGSGSLTAQGGSGSSIGGGAGIGTSKNETGGNIVINGGTVNATGGRCGAGIGTGLAMGMHDPASITCGDITINGGTVIATGGQFAAGIGTGVSTGKNASNECGAITIGTGVISVTATKGSGSPNSIGKGDADNDAQTCGTITIGGDATTYATGVTASPFTYTPSN